MSEPKVTECWVGETESGLPHLDIEDNPLSWNRAAVMLFKEDYDALTASLKHREELYWKLTAEFIVWVLTVEARLRK